MEGNEIYTEKLSSTRTEALFMGLMLLFLGLFIWSVLTERLPCLSIAFLFFFVLFLFYSLNYRVLEILIDADTLVLKFGLFTWHVLFSNIENVWQDETSLWRIGGAGIHFTFLQKRYRAMFNFLEYPRVVVALKQKKGLVRDIAFSTRQLGLVMQLIRERLS